MEGVFSVYVDGSSKKNRMRKVWMSYACVGEDGRECVESRMGGTSTIAEALAVRLALERFQFDGTLIVVTDFLTLVKYLSGECELKWRGTLKRTVEEIKTLCVGRTVIFRPPTPEDREYRRAHRLAKHAPLRED